MYTKRVGTGSYKHSNLRHARSSTHMMESKAKKRKVDQGPSKGQQVLTTFFKPCDWVVGLGDGAG